MSSYGSNNTGTAPDPMFKRLEDLKKLGLLNQDFRDSLMRLQNGLQDKTINASARDRSEKLLRYQVVLGGIDGSAKNAELWADGHYDEVGDRNTGESRLRLGLADQIFTAIRSGGVNFEGRVNDNVVGIVLNKVDQLDPSLNKEISPEIDLGKTKQNPGSIEGN